ncbi:PH domain containing protein [Trichuris trichiura]|uniref:PH domain containing protein n=1 Tax=Trichuris trichiura TaxID=36087 RepID=A0A077Z4P8_TRITR|nr:PH domain containing protein [Trichuris trichiura]
MLEGYLLFRSSKKAWTKAYFRVNNDFVLYRHANDKHTLQEKTPRACLPLPGVRISLPDTRQESGKANCTVFVIEHKNRTYFFRCASQEETAKWMAVLDLASRAEIPTDAGQME